MAQLCATETLYILERSEICGLKDKFFSKITRTTFKISMYFCVLMGIVATAEEISKIADDLRKQGKKIVTTNGCFDILHTGHVQVLQEAKNLGDVLIVCVNSDSSVKQNKGDKRPINSEKDRAKLISALQCVDYAVIFNEKEPSAILCAIKPNIHTKAADYTIDKIIEKKVVEENGGEIKILNLINGKSTTSMITKIVEAYGTK